MSGLPAPLLEAHALNVRFHLQTGQTLHALTDISFDLQQGEALGVVGESGSGKSTLARALLRLLPPHSGGIRWRGKALDALNKAELRTFRRSVQCIFQDPLDALDPRMTIAQILHEPLLALRPDLKRKAIQQRGDELLEAVGLEAGMRNRYPHEFSGGQCQRIGIARALAVEPELLICDEPVSALDVGVQRQVLQLLTDLRASRQLALLFISHDLGVVRHLCDHVLVLYLGRIMEIADTASLYAEPLHPYTHLLLQAIPLPDPRLERERLSRIRVSSAEIPSPLNPPSGCVFNSRCPQAASICKEETPALRQIGGRWVACHLA